MDEERSYSRLGIVLDSVIMAFWSGGLLFLLNGERFKYFLRPTFAVGLFVALFLCVVCLIAIVKTKAHGDGAATVIRLVRAAILILPLLYAVAAGKTVLDSHAFATRWIIPVSKESATQKTPVTPVRGFDLAGSGEEDDAELVEAYRKHGLTPSIYDLVQFGDRYAGKHITTVGMVAWDKERPDRFYLFRFVIVCCAADAQPAAVVVECANKRRPAQNTWVRVEGEVDIVGDKGNEDLVIRHPLFTPTKPPEDPYLY